MKREMKLLAAATAAAILAGCASGGGGRGAGVGEPDSQRAAQAPRLNLVTAYGCLVFGFFGINCLDVYDTGSSQSESTGSSTTATNSSSSTTPSQWGASGQSAAVSSALEPVAFTSWQDNPGDAGITAEGVGATVKVNRWSDPVLISPDTWGQGGGTVTLVYEPSGQLRESRTYTGTYAPRQELADRYGQPGIDAAWSPTNLQQTAFSAVKTDGVAMVANPYDAGWNYQSFGVWTEQEVPSFEYVRALSFGAATPGPAVPGSGSATFTGKLAGMFITSTKQGGVATADLNVRVDFAARSLNLASTGTMVDNRLIWTPSPGLDVSGTLTYAPGSGRFSGTLVNAAGTMSGTSTGQFYGPAAQELGGEFVLKSPTTAETFVGAYGAKR
jgi:C-lobe and N-lobe beta barrels of Tf-binding protein B